MAPYAGIRILLDVPLLMSLYCAHGHMHMHGAAFTSARMASYSAGHGQGLRACVHARAAMHAMCLLPVVYASVGQ